jgi:DME family drug/metabolite transporter
LGGLRLAIGAIALLIAVPFLGGSRRGVVRLGRRPTIWVMAVSAAAFQPLFFGAVDRAGVAISTLVAIGGVPVFAGLIGWVVLSHQPNSRWVIATAIAVAGLVLQSWEHLQVGDGLGVLMALIAAFCVGCYVVATKSELDRGTPAVEIPATAYTIGALLLGPLVLAQPPQWTLQPGGAAVVIYLGVVTMGIGNLLTIQGIKRLTPGPAATLLLSEPLMATILGVVILHETMTTSGVLGMVLILTGLVLQARTSKLSAAIATTPP